MHAAIFVIGLTALMILFGCRSLPHSTRSDAVLVLVFSLIVLGGARPAKPMAVLGVSAMMMLREGSYSIYILDVPLRVCVGRP
jgi:peptidoglycan/LPS O-acetylase OafA/YrhL